MREKKRNKTKKSFGTFIFFLHTVYFTSECIKILVSSKEIMVFFYNVINVY